MINKAVYIYTDACRTTGHTIDGRFAFECWWKTPALRCGQVWNLLESFNPQKANNLQFPVVLSVLFSINARGYMYLAQIYKYMMSFQLEQLYSLSLCSREDCLRILSRYQWNLQLASRYLIRWSREDRPSTGERERPPVSKWYLKWFFRPIFTFLLMHGWLTISAAATSCFTLTHSDTGSCPVLLDMGTDGRSSA